MGDQHRITHALMNEVLLRAVDALQAGNVPNALMGGLASAALGRSRHTHDIDLFVRELDADRALGALERAGFRTERTDPTWLYKAFWSDTMVDVIFVSKGGVRFDEDMREHCRPVEIGGRPIDALGPEDMLVIKAVANAEHVPRHWHDALSIVAAGDLDWPYLLRRARPHASRVASLLLYALSDGQRLPAEPVRELVEAAMADVPPHPAETEAEHHLTARLREALATDPRVNEPHLSVLVCRQEVTVRGQVATPARRRAIGLVLRELAGDHRVRNEVEVT
ncbi:MAG: BON domain-containing protein [Chloroflexi bacterium]|nr:MAG: BON domain-containing protein [Chloroflexota bacterium]